MPENTVTCDDDDNDDDYNTLKPTFTKIHWCFSGLDPNSVNMVVFSPGSVSKP